MLDQHQLAQLADARTDLAFLVNGCVAAGLGGVTAGAWLAAHGKTLGFVATLVVAVGLASLLYALAVPAALRLGVDVQAAAIDLYRLELYKRLGFALPVTHQEDQLTGTTVSRLLAFSEATPDTLRLSDSLRRGPDEELGGEP